MKRMRIASGVAVASLFLGACSQEAPAPGEAAGEETAAASNDNGTSAAETEIASADDQAEAAGSSTAATVSTADEAEVIDGITNKRLSFAPGTSSARIEGSITGYETVDYLLNVRAGQSMNISMASKNTAAYFNLLEPGETEVAVFNGSISENMFEGVAAKSGDYRIRVYLYRNAARRGEKAEYALEAAVS
ncbi:hypothetical protein [Altererythrobacter sp.]|uniref:hypothetical protein n=1 Tax=Altererythrobacter sp. TaxID=1872480 RepID=UPI003D07ED57